MRTICRMRHPIIVAIFFTILLIAIHPGGGRADSGFTVGTSRTALLIWLAEANGYLDDAGIHVEEITSGVEGARRVVSGSLTAGTSSEFAVVSRIMEDPVLCIYASLSASRTTRLISRSDRVGPNATDLEGHRVAVTPNGVGQYFLSQYFLLNGVDEQAVEIVPAGPYETVALVTEGVADAAMTWEPHVSRIREALGDLTQEYPDQSDQYYHFVIHGRCDQTEEETAAMIALLDGVRRADIFAQNNPDAAQQILSERLSIPAEDMARLWPQHSLRVSLPQDLVIAMEAEADWRISVGASEGPVPNMLNHIASGPLRAVDETLVRIVE